MSMEFLGLGGFEILVLLAGVVTVALLVAALYLGVRAIARVEVRRALTDPARTTPDDEG